jgi:hypothetical protein
MKKTTRFTAVIAALSLAFGVSTLPASAVVTTVKDCAFGPAQVFDVQWYISGGNLNISGVTRPYGNVGGQLSEANWQTGYYLKFIDSTATPGTLALERFNSSDVSQGLLSTTGTFRAYGDDFIFYLGGGFFGTVITTGDGYAYGSSASLPITAENPTTADILAYTNCIETPLAAGENREDVAGDGGSGGGGDNGGGDNGGGDNGGGDNGGGDNGGGDNGGGDNGDGDNGGGESADPTLALNLKVRVGQLLAGKAVDYNGEGLMAESEYVLELHSVVVELGSGNADAEGTFTNTVTLPDDIEPGPHRIILRGIDPEGNTLERIAYIYVSDDGRLLAKSFDGPIDEADLLALTGFSGYDPAATAAIAFAAILVGAVAVMRRRIRP